MDVKFGTGMHLDHILDEFDGQGHRSKVKVEKCYFGSILLPLSALCDMIHCYGIKYGVM